MILQAVDTIHVSAVSLDNIITGQVFEIDDLAARSLIARGLAIQINAPAVFTANPAAQSAPETLGNAAGEPITSAMPIARRTGANTRTKAH